MTEQALPSVTDALRALARSEAEAIAQEVTGVRAVVIATSDGFDIAVAAHAEVDAQRIAALASSMAAIGAVVSTEAGLGRSTSVTVGTDNGFAVVYAATHQGHRDLQRHARVDHAAHTPPRERLHRSQRAVGSGRDRRRQRRDHDHGRPFIDTGRQRRQQCRRHHRRHGRGRLDDEEHAQHALVGRVDHLHEVDTGQRRGGLGAQRETAAGAGHGNTTSSFR